MGYVVLTESHLQNMANALRDKLGVSDTFTPSEMASAIMSIPSGEILYKTDISNSAGVTAYINRKSTATGQPFPYGSINISENGTYDVTDYVSATVNINPNAVAAGLLDGTAFKFTLDVSEIMPYALYSNLNIWSISFPETLRIGSYAFCICSNLYSISLPKVRYIGDYAFQSCCSLSGIVLPSAYEIGPYAFTRCSALAVADLQNANDIGQGAFYLCSSLVSVNAPSVYEMRSYTFYGCYSLASVNIPNVNTVYPEAFEYCSALCSISLPSASLLYRYAFVGCRSLESVYLLGGSAVDLYYSSASLVFYNTPISNSGYLGHYGSIFVPSSLYSVYMSNARWSYYYSRIVSYTG